MVSTVWRNYTANSPNTVHSFSTCQVKENEDLDLDARPVINA